MIPKIIHYCWFGNAQKDYMTKKCIESFGQIRGCKIVEWNETNCSFDETEYVKQAYEQRSWAHVSDYYRLKRLYECKQSLRAVLRTLIKIYTFAPKFKFGTK